MDISESYILASLKRIEPITKDEAMTELLLAASDIVDSYNYYAIDRGIGTATPPGRYWLRIRNSVRKIKELCQ